MTDEEREKAIENLEFSASVGIRPSKEAFKVALEALEALKQEPCEDAISRKEVINELNRLGRNAFKDDTDYDNFFAFVDNLQSVTSTRKHGEWIEEWDSRMDINGEYDEWVEYKCSKCGFQDVNIDSCDIERYNFCPSCGADMRGEWTDEVIEKQGNKLIECITTEAYKIARGNIDKARKIMAGKISEEEEKQLIFGADMRKEQSNV